MFITAGVCWAVVGPALQRGHRCTEHAHGPGLATSDRCAFFFLGCAMIICYIEQSRYKVKSDIFNCVCEIINDHRTAGTRRVPCRNTRSVTNAAATRLDHTRLKGNLACGERPHTPGQQAWGRTLCASLGRCFPFEMTCSGRCFGTLWSSFRSGRRGRGWI